MKMPGQRHLLGALLAGGLAACAGKQPPRELLDARYAFEQASVGPAARAAPQALTEARAALDQANASFEQEGGSERTRAFSYVAQRRAQLAVALANVAVADAQRREAEARMAQAQQSTRSRLSAAEAELERQRYEREQAERQAQEAQRLQAEADRLAAEQQTQAQTEAERRAAAEREAQRQAELERERQARQQAEAQLAEVQKREQEARDAQQRTAEALRALGAREEARGTVLTLSGSILFPSGKATLLPASRQRLNQVAEALKNSPAVVTIEGHTDSQGGDEYNLELSERRAMTVRDFLVSRGVSSERVRSEGHGEERPVTENKTAEGRANNRRVEIVLQRPQGPGQTGTGGGGSQQQPQQ